MSENGYTKFQLDPRLGADTFVLGELSLSRLLRFDDQRYPWLILVPRQAACVEFIDLSEVQQVQLAKEIRWVSTVLKQHFPEAKLNVGALGNVVSQLHVHLVMRLPEDPAWPGPVWGHSAAVPCSSAQQQQEQALWQGLIERMT